MASASGGAGKPPAVTFGQASASGGAGKPPAASKVTFGTASVRTIPGRIEEVEAFMRPTPRRKEEEEEEEEEAFVRPSAKAPSARVDRKLFGPINRSLGNAEFPVGERVSRYTFAPRTTSRPLINVKGAYNVPYDHPIYHPSMDELLAKLMARRGVLHFKSPEGASRVGEEVFKSGRLSIPSTMGPGKTVLPEVNYIPNAEVHEKQLADAAAAAEIVRKETEAKEAAKIEIIRSSRAGAVDGVAKLLANEKGGRRSRTRRHKRKRAARQSKRRTH